MEKAEQSAPRGRLLNFLFRRALFRKISRTRKLNDAAAVLAKCRLFWSRCGFDFGKSQHWHSSAPWQFLRILPMIASTNITSAPPIRFSYHAVIDEAEGG
jgi:hypothetical protein